MKIINGQKNTGFTLIETMVAVFILTISLTAFFGVVASSLFSARYANNEITATYLLQEAADAIRNDRDTFYQTDGQTGWALFKAKYLTACSSGTGCKMEPGIDNSVSLCGSGATGGFGSISCPLFNYDSNATNNDFYTYAAVGTPSRFKRGINVSTNPQNTDELDITVTVEWQNGNLTRTQSLVTSLLDWRKNLW